MNRAELPRISVFLADDHPIFLDGVRHLLQDAADIELIGEASSGSRAAAMISAAKPRVAVLDVSMPDMNGIAVLNHLSRTAIPTRVIMLTVSDDPSIVGQALRSGARGFVLKRSARDNLLFAIRAVSRNGLYIDPLVAGRMMETGNGRRQGAAAGTRNPAGPELTPRETDVLKRIALGFTVKEIASQISVTTKSVETYKNRATEKLQLGSRAKIVQFAILQGWFDPS